MDAVAAFVAGGSSGWGATEGSVAVAGIPAVEVFGVQTGWEEETVREAAGIVREAAGIVREAAGS